MTGVDSSLSSILVLLERQNEMHATLLELESRVDLLHQQVRESHSMISRLKLLADLAKASAGEDRLVLGQLVEAIARVEARLSG